MVKYYNSKSEVEKALSEVKTADEAKKIMNDLETRMAPSEWVDIAFDAMRKFYVEMQ